MTEALSQIEIYTTAWNRNLPAETRQDVTAFLSIHALILKSNNHAIQIPMEQLKIGHPEITVNGFWGYATSLVTQNGSFDLFGIAPTIKARLADGTYAIF